MTRFTKVRLITAVALTLGMLAPLLGSAVTPASAVSDVQTDRIGGTDRFETAANVARAGHPGAGTALIANGLNFPDALAGSTLAGALNAPILLVAPRSIPAATSRALNDLGVNDIVILGGPAAVSTEVENQFRQNYGVTRVFGDDRYKTAVEIARRAAVAGVGTVNGVRTAFVSTGLNFPDALGAGPLAYEGRLPSFLTRPNQLPPEVAQAIRDLNIEHVVILGGTQAVSGTVEAQIEATGVTTERLNGRNRAETATFVADFALGRMGFEGANVLLARGDTFPDALAGGPLGGERRAVILLTATPCQLAIETRDWLEEHFGTVSRITALGGQSAVCDAVLREAEQAAETNNIPPDRVELTISGGSTDGGPEWQYQESDANPSKSLTLTAFVSSPPGENAGNEAQRVPAAREDVVFNIRPSQGDPEGNTELNLTARTGTNGLATVSYTRANPGTDIITVRLADDTTVTDDGVGRWGTDPAPILLDPNEPATLEVNQPREFEVRVPGTDPRGVRVNLTTLELVDDDPSNDTNVAALSFGPGSDEVVDPATGARTDPTPVTDDRGDSDETIATVLARPSPDEPGTSIGIFTVSSNSAQIFTLMAFRDTVAEPAANDDNTNPPEVRDIAGVTAFVSRTAGLSMAPPNDGGTITRRNGQQIVYSVTSVDAQGQPSTAPVDVSFEQLTDNQGATTTTAEFDWYDNSANPSTQEGSENQVPPGATPTSAGTRRIQVTPNSQGTFTFAITHPQNNTFSTSGNPIAWIDLPGGTDNRPDQGEPQARGRNFTFNTGAVAGETSTLESLACPPGVPVRGTAENPLTVTDPCLGMDVLPATSTDPDRPHNPWPVNVVAESPNGPNASTCGPAPATTPNEGAISRGDLVQRFTFRDATGAPKTASSGTVTFAVRNNSLTNLVSAAPNRGHAGCQQAVPVPPLSTVEITISSNGPHVELVVDGDNDTTATISIVGTSGVVPPTIVDEIPAQTVRWLNINTDTTSATGTPESQAADPARCPSPSQPCFNGNLVSIDKARDSYVMNQGGPAGGIAYVVYAIGGGGKIDTDADGNVIDTPERRLTLPPSADEYFINGLPAPPEPSDDKRCGYWANVIQGGCARFDHNLTFDDTMVYEFGPMQQAGTPPANVEGTRTQTHFLTNGDAPAGEF